MIHWFDLFVAFFLFASAFWSYFRGFTKEAFSVVALVAGYLAASKYYQNVTPAFEDVVAEPALRQIAAFLSLFFVAVILVVIVSIYARRLLKISEVLSTADRLAGFILGIMKGGLILALMAYPFSLAPGVKEEVLKGSITASILIGLSGELLGKVAPSFASDIDKAGDSAHGLKKEADKIGRYSKKLEEIGKSIEKIKDKVMAETTDTTDKSEAKNGDKDIISDGDRSEMDELLKRVDQ